MVQDAIRRSLSSMQIKTLSAVAPVSSSELQAARRWIAKNHASVGLLAAELKDGRMFRDAMAIVSTVELEWVVLTSTRPGPVWGAVLDAGVSELVHSTATLHEVVTVLQGAASRAEHARSTTSDRVVSQRAWQRMEQAERQMVERLATLSVREMEILEGLAEGSSPRALAVRAGVSESTVRGQIKSLLRKLGFGSQLQATASYWRWKDWFCNDGLPSGR